MMARECLRECLQGMHEWYETAFFPISIRTTSEAVLQSFLTSEKRAAAFGGGWPATYQGAVGPAEAPKVEAGKAAYRSYFPAPFGTSALPITDQIRAISEAVHATVSSGGGVVSDTRPCCHSECDGGYEGGKGGGCLLPSTLYLSFLPLVVFCVLFSKPMSLAQPLKLSRLFFYPFRLQKRRKKRRQSRNWSRTSGNG